MGIDRGRVLNWLTPRRMRLMTADVAGGAGLAFVLSVWTRPRLQDSPWWLGLSGVMLLAAFAAWETVRFLRNIVAWFPTGRPARILRLVVAALVLAGVVWWVAAVGPGAAWSSVTDTVLAALPAIFVLVFAVWAVLLVSRWTVRSRRRWIRGLPHVVFLIAFGVFLLVLFERDALLDRPAAGLLVPVGVWAAIGTWKTMSRSGHVAVNAAADIVLSLLLGTALVLTLVWVANLLGLPRAEVAVLRTVLHQVGSFVDLPWWVWTVLYLLLATSAVLATLRPAKGGARTLPLTNAVRRVLSGLHIGLMLTVLVAVAAPTSLEATLRHQVRTRYTLAVQRVLADQGRQAAYEQIRRQFTATSAQPVTVQPLRDMLTKIHGISRPAHPGGDASDTEHALARRLGQVQAATFDHGSPPPADPAVPDADRFDDRIRDTADLDERLDRLDSRQQQDDEITVQLERAAEAATIAVASLVQLPDLGSNEILQIVKEYLSGLVESSPLKEIFTAWANRAVPTDDVPPADRLVVPDPRRLRIVAQFKLIETRLKVRVADPFTPDRARLRTDAEPDVVAAVDLTNEARFLVEHRGPCDGCPRPLRPGEDPFRRPGEPGREERPRPPEIHVR
jgi:hypothetical protein